MAQAGAEPVPLTPRVTLTAWGVLDEMERQGLVTLADKGYQGSSWVIEQLTGRHADPAALERQTQLAVRLNL